MRTPTELGKCDGLIIPGGESTTISLVAARSGMLEPLREFVKYVHPLDLPAVLKHNPQTYNPSYRHQQKQLLDLTGLTQECVNRVHRNPTWGTCAGLILLSESANKTSTKATGQELIGGLDVLINRNHFGRQVESFSAELDLPFLSSSDSGWDSNSGRGDEGRGNSGLDSNSRMEGTQTKKFHSVFIRAPVVEKILPHKAGAQEETNGIIVAPSKSPADSQAQEVISAEVEIMARLPGRAKAFAARSAEIGGLEKDVTAADVGEEGDIIAVRQGNVFGTSFHPELTGDGRIHVWWLGEVERAKRRRRGIEI